MVYPQKDRSGKVIYILGIIFLLILTGMSTACGRLGLKDTEKNPSAANDNPANSKDTRAAQLVLSQDEIDTPAKFHMAYKGGISLLPKTECEKWQKLAESGKANYLLKPEESAIAMLNLKGGEVKYIPEYPTAETHILYDWGKGNSVFVNLIQPVQQGTGGIWLVTGFNSLTEDGFYWYDDIVNFSDGLVEVMGQKIGYPRPSEAEVDQLLTLIDGRQREVMMSRAVKCYVAARMQKYDDLIAICANELAQEIKANFDGQSLNAYGGQYLIELKDASEIKPEKIYHPQAVAGESLYAVRIEYAEQSMEIRFILDNGNNVAIREVKLLQEDASVNE